MVRAGLIKESQVFNAHRLYLPIKSTLIFPSARISFSTHDNEIPLLYLSE